MSATRIVINMGSENTTVFLEGKGIVLNEKTLMLLKGEAIFSVGNKAFFNLENEIEKDVSPVYPIQNGKITSVLWMASLLRIFLSKVIEEDKTRIIAGICVPCGLSASEKKDYLSAAYKAGISTVYLCPIPVCAYFDNVELLEKTGGIVADLGSQCCDIAYVNDGKILYGYTIEFDNKNIDSAISEMVQTKYGALITLEIAKQLKESVATLNFSVVTDKLVTGLNVEADKVKKVRVSAVDVSGVVKNFYDLIFDEILELIKDKHLGYDLPILLTGGGAQIDFLAEYGKNYTNMQVFCGKKDASVFGFSKILKDKKIFLRVIKKKV